MQQVLRSRRSLAATIFSNMIWRPGIAGLWLILASLYHTTEKFFLLRCLQMWRYQLSSLNG